MIVKTDGLFAALLTRYLLCLPELLSTRSSGSVGCPILWSLSSIVMMGRRYSSSQQAGSLLSLVLIAFVQVAGYGPNISFEINRYDQPPARSLNETF